MSEGTIGPRASSHYQIWPSLKKVWTPLGYIDCIIKNHFTFRGEIVFV